MKTKIVFFSLLIIALLTSCLKDGIELNKEQECSNILTFKNVEEFNNELTNVLKLSNEEKIKWEQQKGFKSFGVAAEKFYKTINPDEFNSADEVKAFVRKNSKYIQFVDEGGEISVETKFYNEPLRFFINYESIFQVGERVYKVLENGVVATSLQNLEKLKAIDNSNLYQIEEDSDLSFLNNENMKSIETTCSGNSGGGYCASEPLTIDYGSYKKTYRTTIEIRPKHWDDYYSGTVAASWYYARCQVRRLGIWFGHETSIYINVTAQLDYWHRLYGQTIVPANETYVEEAMSLERYKGFIASDLTAYDPSEHYNSFNIHANINIGADSEVSF